MLDKEEGKELTLEQDHGARCVVALAARNQWRLPVAAVTRVCVHFVLHSTARQSTTHHEMEDWRGLRVFAA